MPGARPVASRHVTIRRPRFSLRINLRVVVLCVAVAVVTLGLAVWAMMLGRVQISAVDVIRTVLGQGDSQQDFVVNTLRLPRVLLAILVGAGLAAAGAIFQALVRNPLVSPDIIGIDSGANLFVTFWIVGGLAWTFVPVVAFAGATASALVIYALSWRGGIAPNRLILVGIGIGEVLAALTTLIVVSGTIEEVRPAQVWSIGSVYGASWSDVRVIGLPLLVLLPIATLLMWPLRVLQIGEDSARSLGLGVERLRLVMLLIGCGLAACCVAVAGPIGFVALMIPHVARLIAGPISGSVLVLTALIGGLFLLLADVIGQHALPITLPVGILTSAIGAPYFIYLLYRTNRRGTV